MANGAVDAGNSDEVFDGVAVSVAVSIDAGIGVVPSLIAGVFGVGKVIATFPSLERRVLSIIST